MGFRVLGFWGLGVWGLGSLLCLPHLGLRCWAQAEAPALDPGAEPSMPGNLDKKALGFRGLGFRGLGPISPISPISP